VTGDAIADLLLILWDSAKGPESVVKPVALQDRGQGDRRIVPVGVDASEVFCELAVSTFASDFLTAGAVRSE
jgi:enhancing lycopene biosynthesis protein 2